MIALFIGQSVNLFCVYRCVHGVQTISKQRRRNPQTAPEGNDGMTPV